MFFPCSSARHGSGTFLGTVCRSPSTVYILYANLCGLSCLDRFAAEWTKSDCAKLSVSFCVGETMTNISGENRSLLIYHHKLYGQGTFDKISEVH